jgi:hypothetical protein
MFLLPIDPAEIKGAVAVRHEILWLQPPLYQGCPRSRGIKCEILEGLNLIISLGFYILSDFIEF